MFETTGKLDRKALSEIAENMTEKWRRYILCGIGALSFIFLFVAARDRDMFALLMCAIIAGIVAYSMFIRPLRWGNRQYEAIQRSGAEHFTYTVSYRDSEIRVRNETTGWSGGIAYSDIDRIVDTPGMLVLFTRTGKYAITFKNGLSGRGAADLIGFLKKKPTGIKWRRTKFR